MPERWDPVSELDTERLIRIRPDSNLPVLRIRIRRIRMFVGLLDPDPLVRGMDPDPSITKQKSKKNLVSYCFVTFIWPFIFEKWFKCTFKKYRNKQKNFFFN